ncbi:MAG: TetR/AcrR family transcriptional regulator [Suipraeoptans sp.]
MDAKKTDRRIAKTKKAIRKSFVDLLTKKNINDITITDIADSADITRKTFYNYYSGVYQVVDEIENEIITAFEADLIDFDFNRDIQNPSVIFKKISKIINDDVDFYGLLFMENSYTNLTSKIVLVLKEKTIAFFAVKNTSDMEIIQIITDYTISGIVSVYQSWFNSDRKMPLDNLAKIVSDILLHGIKHILSKIEV